MADFKTHVGVSTALGVAYGGAAYAGTQAGLFEVPPQTFILAGALCSVSGMLPDIDSNSGRPLRESLAFMAAVVPMMLADRFRLMGISPETTVMFGALVYIFVRFGLGYFLKHYTVHRGMFHSLPAALIFGQLAFLLASGDDWRLRLYKAGGVFLGYMSHLMMDEIYSVQWNRGWLHIKKSFGTAMKIFDTKSIWANVSTYVKLGILTYIVIYEPGWAESYRQKRAERWYRESQPRTLQEAIADRNPPVPTEEVAPEDDQGTAGRLLDRFRR